MTTSNCSVKPPQPSDLVTGSLQVSDDSFQKFIEKFGELPEGAAKNMTAARVFGIFSAAYTVIPVAANAWKGNYEQAFIDGFSALGGVAGGLTGGLAGGGVASIVTGAAGASVGSMAGRELGEYLI